MSDFVYVLFGITTAVLYAITMKFQDATFYWGKLLQPENELNPRKMQNAITPPIQNIRNIIAPIMLISIIVWGIILYNWWLGLIIVLIVFVLSTLIGKLWPSSDSDYYYKKILNSLVSRGHIYDRNNTTLQKKVNDEILTLFENIKK